MERCDVVILSKASNRMLVNMTQQAIDSLIRSEEEGTFRIIVLEQCEVDYRGAETVRMGADFNYNRFANIGVGMGSSDWLCVSNNDVVFHKGWFSGLMRVGRDVMSPKCPLDQRQRNVHVVTEGYEIGRHFSGWCFVMRRRVWEVIGGFDEDFIFFCADNSVVEQLRGAGYIPVLVPGSEVTHMRSVTLRGLRGAERDEKTRKMVIKFKEKYGGNMN